MGLTTTRWQKDVQHIDFEEEIHAGDQIVMLASDKRSGKIEEYVSQVEKLTGDGIVVALSGDRTGEHRFREGATVTVSFWKEYAEYRFKSRILDRAYVRLPRMVLSRPANGIVVRMPRRRYARVKTRIPATLYTARTVKTEAHETEILDLSAEGCRLKSPIRIRTEFPVLLDFDLPFSVKKEIPDQTAFLRQIPGVVKTAPLPSRPKDLSEWDIYILGIQFGNLDEAVRNELLDYIAFREQELELV